MSVAFAPLLSSRIDVYPHQAFVAGAILLDHHRRYLLADEVGLGKTIEAGLVAQDVLAGSENARVLVVCPGALTHQWLAELYGKFGGHVFRILDLVDGRLPTHGARLAIASTSFVLRNRDLMASLKDWDLLIVDEVHRILHSDLYDQIADMSVRSRSLLLLSALPARRRSVELYRLLRLLDPEFYDSDIARARFDEIYENQRHIGRRILLAEKRIRDFREGAEPAEAVIESADRLRRLPVIADDPVVAEAIKTLDAYAVNLADRAEEFCYVVADRYRLSRRIFRNRRERLFEKGEIPRVERRLELHLYEAGQVEFEATQSVLGMLRSVSAEGAEPEFAVALARLMLQALAAPPTTAALMAELRDSKAHRINDTGRKLVAGGHLSGYEDADLLRQLTFASVRSFIDGERLERVVANTADWARAGESSRLKILLELLADRDTGPSRRKCLIFAGFPGLAEQLTVYLRSRFGDSAVSEFRVGLADSEKERNVVCFKRRPETWILVSDETGGEGRNFQYVDEIFHFDLPWSVSDLEQRIGRLDRIGRKLEVVSHAIVADGSIEHSFLHCIEDGLGVFRRSISGLELALRAVENRILGVVLKDGDPEHLWVLADEIRATAADERATDEADAVLDAACFNRQRAERFTRVRDPGKSEQFLMSSFINYWKLRAPKGIRVVRDHDAPGDIVEFDADQWMYGDFQLHEELRRGTRRFRGSFKRAAVKNRPRLEFFAPGTPFFDAVTRHAREGLFGRTYAVEVEDTDADSWVGVEAVCRAVPDTVQIEASPYWLGRVQQAFPVVRCSVFVEIGEKTAKESRELLKLRRGLDREGKGCRWWNLRPAEIDVYVRTVTGSNWRDALAQVVSIAKEQALGVVRSPVESRLRPELERLGSEIRRLDKPVSSERRSIECMLDALSNWHIDVEGLGVLSRNGGLRPRRGD